MTTFNMGELSQIDNASDGEGEVQEQGNVSDTDNESDNESDNENVGDNWILLAS